MVAGTWKPLVGDGIMIWEPMKPPAVKDTQQQCSQLVSREPDVQDELQGSYDNEDCNSVLPSVEISNPNATAAHLKSERHDLSSAPSMTSISSVPLNGDLISSDSATNPTPTSSPLLHCSWVEQLKTFAELPEDKCTPLVYPGPLTPLEPSGLSLNVSYDAGYTSDRTDRTDHVLDSPCPRPYGARDSQRLSPIHKESKVRKKREKAGKKSSVIRRLDFGSVSTSKLRKPKNEHRTPKKRLMGGILERSPSHRKAFPMYHDVFGATLFSDPTGKYDKARHDIEEAASMLGIKLVRLDQEVKSPSGKAATAKSPLTRRYYKALVRQARKSAIKKISVEKSSIKKSYAGQKAGHPDLQALHIGGCSIATSDQDEGVLTDAEDAEGLTNPDVVPLIEYTEGLVTSCTVPPCLLFRVWDASSRTSFGPDGFTSSAFKEWSVIPPPIPPNDPHDAFKLLAHLHLTAESLIQVLTIAARLDRPQIAVIDLRAACMQEAHKTHLAAETLKWLKTDGKIKLRYRYQGHGDWLEDLDDLCKHDDAAARLMNLDAFKPHLKTFQVASAMRERSTTLNTHVAGTIGRVANLFLGNTRASTQHISAFVARLVDGWAIEKNAATDVHSLSSMAAAFASHFGRHSGCSRQELMGAFQDGIDEGTRCAARWSRSTSGRRKSRRR
ncbi:hypothetical protein IAQ61_009536 [Plenodomus lingam]|uniref:uncharacterized protein n=1 Tax=Leptosphaeria maculans TaxID=5022 RepID=UPI00332FF92D|nr:hypothetical protein IAQ61_009536 [Plenodomus lingam]